ncbi:hypothetical protein P4W15_19215 [Morganella morganii]|nr:hypothetical protein [Morganella morganii]
MATNTYLPAQVSFLESCDLKKGINERKGKKPENRALKMISLIQM